MVENRKSTAKEELKWRAEFEALGREAVRAKSSDFRPYIKRDLAVRWLREQELARNVLDCCRRPRSHCCQHRLDALVGY